MRKMLISIGCFMIGFAASCITFYAIGGQITQDRLVIASILGMLSIYCNNKKNRD